MTRAEKIAMANKTKGTYEQCVNIFDTIEELGRGDHPLHKPFLGFIKAPPHVKVMDEYITENLHFLDGSRSTRGSRSSRV